MAEKIKKTGNFHLYLVEQDPETRGANKLCPHSMFYESINDNIACMCGGNYCRTSCQYRGPLYTDETVSPVRVAIKCYHPDGQEPQNFRYGTGATSPSYAAGPAQDVTDSFEC